MSMDDVNKNAFSLAVRQYARDAHYGLTFQEEFCLSLIPGCRRTSVLDIGIGGGRTTGPLTSIFDSYTGLDYAAPLVEVARKYHPHLDLSVGDARELDAESEYDCVMFSFNGIDYIPYEDRKMVHRGAFKVLRPGGYYIYSSHNAQCHRAKAYLNEFWVKELLSNFLRPWRTLQVIQNRVRYFHQQRDECEKGYLLLNDAGVRFGLLGNYIYIEKELETLSQIGFNHIHNIGCKKQEKGYDADDEWVYIMLQKPNGESGL